MKVTGLVIFLLIGCLSEVLSCSSHSVSTQSELNQLSICTIMTGDLIIETSTSQIDPITNLDSLENLISVGNLIIINNPFLRNISGLMNLDTVRGDLNIRNNLLLTECCVLNRLLTMGVVGGNVFMTGNSTFGNCNNDGSNISACRIIPSLHTWGIIILFLMLVIMGVVKILNIKLVPIIQLNEGS